MAARMCVVCAKADATCRCTVDQSTQFGKFKFGEDIQDHTCAKALAKKGGDEHCAVVQNANVTCGGLPRTITFTDYQQMLASDGGSTYEPGLIPTIGNKITKAWICLASMFKDC
jgi:hypothetical protein